MLQKLKNGDYGLFTTFWVFVACFPGLLRVVEVALFTAYAHVAGQFYLGDTPVLVSAFLFAVAFAIAAFELYYVYALMGVWRSAKKYEGSEIWPFMAKVMVVILALETPLHLLYGFINIMVELLGLRIASGQEWIYRTIYEAEGFLGLDLV